MEMGKDRLVGEIDMLKNDKRALLKEIASLQYENRTTIQLMNSVNQRMQSAEMRQKQMISFLAHSLFKEHNGIAPSRARRKFLKHTGSGCTASIGSMDLGASNRHCTADASSSPPPTLDSSEHVLNKENPDNVLSDSIGEFELQTRGKSLIECHDQFQDETLAPFFLDTNIVPSSPDTAATASVSDHLLSFPEGDISVANAIIDQEEVWKAVTEAGPRSFDYGGGDVWFGTAQAYNVFYTDTQFDSPWDLDLQILDQEFSDGDIAGFVDRWVASKDDLENIKS